MTTAKNVKKQYTLYPYPKYKKSWDKDKKKGPEATKRVTFPQLTHYCYQGKKSFKNYRILIAGCGLGTTAIHWAMDLAQYNGEVVAIDVSPSTLAIMKNRVKFYNLKNIKIKQMSLLDLTPKTFGSFDFIVCAGVLHHLKDPVMGLKTLRSVLKENGVIEIMVYAQYGRTGIYQTQELLRRMNKDVPDYETKINNFKKIYPQLPQTHLLKHFERIIRDHTVSDNGIVDLLLHCQDRAYTIPQLYDYVQSCGLNIACHILPSIRKKLTNPIPSIDYKNMTQIEKEAINEVYYGDIIQHHVLLTKTEQPIPTINDKKNIPVFNYTTKKQVDGLINIINNTPRQIVTININKQQSYKHNGKVYIFNHANGGKISSFNAILHKYLLLFLGYIDEKRNTEQIVELLTTNHNATQEDIQSVLDWMYEIFIEDDRILLKKKNN